MTDITGVSGIRVVDLPVTDSMTKDMDSMDRDMPQLARYHRNRAKLARAYYESLVDSGFEHEDAMHLVSVEFCRE